MEKQYRYYNNDFKKAAVRLSYQRKNITLLERELNITRGLLHKWRQEYEKLQGDCFRGRGKYKINLQSTISTEQAKTDTKSKISFFDSAFKEKAVLLSYERSNISELERELKIPSRFLHSWRYTYEKFGAGCFCGKGSIREDPDRQKIYQLERKCLEAELHLEILKKSYPYQKKGRIAVFEFVKENEQNYPVYKMCMALKISQSSYLIWKKQPVSETKKRIASLKTKITSIFLESSKRYGCVKIAKELTAV